MQKSTNGGLNWTNVSPTVAEGWRVACHPTIPGRVYASSYIPWAVYVSSDSGATWTQSSSHLYFNGLVCDPGDPDRLFCISLAAVYASTDGGATWEVVNELGGRCIAIESIDPAGALYAGTVGGIQRSWNHGVTWQEASSGIRTKTHCLAVSPEGAGLVYAGDDSGYLFKSTDGGESWAFQSHYGNDLAFQNLALSSATDPVTIMGTINGSMYRTLDEGESWSRVLGGSPNKYIFDIETDPDDPLTVWGHVRVAHLGLSFFGLFLSTDGGATWTPTGQLVDVNVIELMFDPWSAPEDVAAVGDDGFYKLADGGLT